MPVLMLTEAADRVVAKDPRNVASCGPLPAFMLSGQPVSNT
jgi:hypothetical protein